MKQGRNVHVPKTRQAKKDYRKYIETLDYDPTINEDLDFSQTSQVDETPNSDSDATSTFKKRPVDLSEVIKDYIKDNWLPGLLTGVISIIILIVGYLVFDSKAAFSKFETMLSNQSEDISEIKSLVKENSDKIVDNRFNIQANKYCVDSLYREIDRASIPPGKNENNQK